MRRVLRQTARAVLIAAALLAAAGHGQADEPASGGLFGIGLPNLDAPTFGGLQFWTDIRYRSGWRVQRNSLTGHYRLIDERDIRRAWGTRDRVLAAFDDMAPAPTDAEGRHLVVLLHGALRTPHSFADLAAALEDHGYTVAALSYDSSQRSFDAIVADFAALLAHLDGYHQVSFVTHSMGGLLVRSLLGRDNRWRQRVDVARVVQIAPPNDGSVVADAMRNSLVFKLLYGPAGRMLYSDRQRALPGIDVPFAIIAGGRGDADGYNPLIPGDDDGLVAVAETRLDGAAGAIIVDALHSFILQHPQTIDAVIRFLDQGRIAGPFLTPAQQD